VTKTTEVKTTKANKKETPTNATSPETKNYLAKYLEDDLLLAAIYEGNALDCELYALAVDLVETRLADLAQRRRHRGAPFPAASRDDLLRHCRQGAAALKRLAPQRHAFYFDSSVEPTTFGIPTPHSSTSAAASEEVP